MLSFFEMLNMLQTEARKKAAVMPKPTQAAIEPAAPVGTAKPPIAPVDPLADDEEDDSPAVVPNPFTGSATAKPVENVPMVFDPKTQKMVPTEISPEEDLSVDISGRRKRISAGAGNYAADLVVDWNNYLASPVYQLFTAQASKDLKLPYKFPRGRFEIALDVSRDKKVKELPEVVMTPRDFLDIKRAVTKMLGFEGVSTSLSQSLSFRQALTVGLNADPALFPIVKRALELERYLLSGKIVGRTTTIQGLANMLAAEAGPSLAGGLGGEEVPDDTDVVAYIIQTSKQTRRVSDAVIGSRPRGNQPLRQMGRKRGAMVHGPRPDLDRAGEEPASIPDTTVRRYQTPFDIFEVDGDLNDPQTKVRVKRRSEVADLDTADDGTDPTKRNYVPLSKIGSALDRARDAFGESTEVTEWCDIMNLVEYWNDNHS
jgi:hypothetical protein